jgi:hypothetical protein
MKFCTRASNFRNIRSKRGISAGTVTRYGGRDSIPGKDKHPDRRRGPSSLPYNELKSDNNNEHWVYARSYAHINR